MSRSSEKGAELERLRAVTADATRLAQAGDTASSAQAIALAITTITSITVLDESRSYERDRAREKAFADELEDIAVGSGAKLPPTARTGRLLKLALWLSEGYDNPPTDDDYPDGVRRDA